MTTKFNKQTANKYADDILVYLYSTMNRVEKHQVPSAWVRAHHKNVEAILKEAFAQVEDEAADRYIDNNCS